MTGFKVIVFITSVFFSTLIAFAKDNQGDHLLGEKSLLHLKETFSSQTGWVKVHAAEHLLALGYREGVKEIFEKELVNFEGSPQYLIGVWRVLARSELNPANKQKWIDKIIAAYKDEGATNRVHAAETLSKLNVPLSEIAPEETDKILRGNDFFLKYFTQWGASFTADGRNNERFASIIDSLHAKEEQCRKTAAYSLRIRGSVSENHWARLVNAAVLEPDQSTAKIYMLGAALVNTPANQLNTEKYKSLKSTLLEKTFSNRKSDRYEMCETLSEIGTVEDVPILVDILLGKNLLTIPSDPSSTNSTAFDHPDNVDVRSAAAHAILSIKRRTEIPLFTWVDWTVVIFYLLAMIMIGVYFSIKSKSTDDYFLGGRTMNPVAVGLSLFATLLSTISYLSYPGEMIKFGPMIFGMVLAYPLAYFILGWFLIPKFMEQKVTSAYELLEAKVGLSVRMLATLLFLALRFLAMATIVYITIDAVVIPTLNIDPAYTLHLSITMTVITLIYTSLGGLKAVVVTDVLQTIILLGGALFTILVISIHYGSATVWIPDDWPGHWEKLEWGLDASARMTVGNAILGALFWQVCTGGSDQMAIQRYIATKDVFTARKTLRVSLTVNFVVMVLLAFLGLAVMYFFTKEPEYLAEGQQVFQSADKLFPRFILIGLPVGIAGLVLAGLLAAAMSSLSSGLNSVSSVVYEDFLKRFRKKQNYSPQIQLRTVQFISIIVGLIIVVISSFIGIVEGNLFEMVQRVVNLFTAPLFVPFFMALLIPFAREIGTIIGTLVSVATAIAISFFKIFSFEVLWIMPISLLTGISVGVALSYAEKLWKKQ